MYVYVGVCMYVHEKKLPNSVQDMCKPLQDHIQKGYISLGRFGDTFTEFV